ncbi:TetR family transcriptional regulator [Promicromonospora sp. MS192]|uniref:TetR family transcriptional regulator n=1 Tax=Promicromonospora sp. MS192 TaxID=3412684 RepID=UPI003C2BB4A9
MEEKPLGLRERTRQMVKAEITDAAKRLFVERGFEATTIDDIAAAVGMSQRSVFRYFASKEEIILGKLGLVVDDALAVLRARPADESLWTSLRHVVDALVSVSATAGEREFVEPIQRLVFESEPLLAGYVQKLQRVQDAVVDVVMERAQGRGEPYEVGDPAPRALTAAMFGCLVAAQFSWLASGAEGTLGEAVDRAVATISPAV